MVGMLMWSVSFAVGWVCWTLSSLRIDAWEEGWDDDWAEVVAGVMLVREAAKE
jgi:hypothetical protein